MSSIYDIKISPLFTFDSIDLHFTQCEYLSLARNTDDDISAPYWALTGQLAGLPCAEGSGLAGTEGPVGLILLYVRCEGVGHLHHHIMKPASWYNQHRNLFVHMLITCTNEANHLLIKSSPLHGLSYSLWQSQASGHHMHMH